MNEQSDERVAQYLRLYSCLFQTTVDSTVPWRNMRYGGRVERRGRRWLGVESREEVEGGGGSGGVGLREGVWLWKGVSEEGRDLKKTYSRSTRKIFRPVKRLNRYGGGYRG